MFLSDDDLVECPYNKTHRMLRRRLQTHLHKCRLSYPDVELKKCPFNTTHLIPEPEFAHHATNCPDRKLITLYKYDAPEPKEEEVPKHAPIECDEDWDDTDVNDYNPQKYLEKAQIIRKPEGIIPSERKKFIKEERKRLGDGDDSSEDESKTSESVKEKSKSPNSFKKCEIKDEDHDFERSYISNSYGSYRSNHSSSLATSSHSRQRSRSPIDDKKTFRDCSPPMRRSSGYSRPYSPQPNSSRRTLSSNNPNEDPYYNGSRCDSLWNSSTSTSYYSHNNASDMPMPEAPPPPMISYPAPRSYSTTKNPPSTFRY